MSRAFISTQIKETFWTLKSSFSASNPFYEVSHISLQNATFKVLKVSSALILLKAFLQRLNSNLKIINGQYYPTCSPLSFWSYIVPLHPWHFLSLAYFQEIITESSLQLFMKYIPLYSSEIRKYFPHLRPDQTGHEKKSEQTNAHRFRKELGSCKDTSLLAST